MATFPFNTLLYLSLVVDFCNLKNLQTYFLSYTKKTVLRPDSRMFMRKLVEFSYKWNRFERKLSEFVDC